MTAQSKVSTGPEAFIGVGSNIDPEKNVEAAVFLLHRRLGIAGVSTFYWTPPIDRPGQPQYLNGVVTVRTGLPVRALKEEVLHEIESHLGRVRTEDSYASRTMDLDLLLYGDQVIQEPGLHIPDPDLRERAFLVAGCLELRPSLRLPDTGQLLDELLREERAQLKPAPAFTERLKEMLKHEQATR